jgi:hypothetical protein
VNRPSLPDPSQSHAESPFSRMATWILSSGAILSLVTGFLLLVFRKDEAREVSSAAIRIRSRRSATTCWSNCCEPPGDR